MRIAGDLMLVLGIIFLILFVMAEFGGGGVGASPFLVSGFLIALGANLRRSGGEILQAKPTPAGTSASSGAKGQEAPPKFSTVEMPMTPEVATTIAEQSARAWKLVKRVVLFFFLFFIVLGVVLDMADKDVAIPHVFLIIFPAIGVAAAIMIGGISWLTTQEPVHRDLHGKNYLRTTGPLEVGDISGGAILRLADRSFIVNGTGGVNELRNLDWGRVDYSPHGHIILGAWDAKGKSVYSAPGYKLEGGASGS